MNIESKNLWTAEEGPAPEQIPLKEGMWPCLMSPTMPMIWMERRAMVLKMIAKAIKKLMKDCLLYFLTILATNN